MTIDMRKLVQQDVEFQQYFIEVLINSLPKESDQFLHYCFVMYQNGIKKERLTKILKEMNRPLW